MRKFIIAAIIFAAPTFTLGQTNVSQNAASNAAEQQTGTPAQELLRINQDFAKAVEKSDGAVLSRLYADDYVGVGFSGQPTTKAEMVASNNTPTATLALYEEDNVKIKIYGDTAVVTSHANLKTRFTDGRVITRRTALTKVWVKHSGGWQIVATQMNEMTPPAPLLEAPKQLEKKTVYPWQNLGKTEQEVLEAHINYLRQTTGPDEAQRRFAQGYFTTASTGVVSDREDIIKRLKNDAARAGAVQSASIEVVKEDTRVLLRTNNGILAMDEFRARAHDDVVTISYRVTNYNKGGRATGQSRVGAAYVKKNGVWQQIFGQATEIIAESSL